MIGYSLVIFAFVVVNYLQALFYFLLFMTLALGGALFLLAAKARRFIRKPNGLVP